MADFADDLADRGHFGGRVGEEHLVGRGQFLRQARTLDDLDAEQARAQVAKHRAPVAEAAGHRIFLIQLCGSFVRPYWMSISCLRSPMATGPAAPRPIRKSPL